MRFIFLSVILVAFFASCNQQEGNKKNNTNQEAVVDKNSKTDSLTLAKNLKSFSDLELFFDNANYQVTKGSDTNYFYFSRSSDFLIQVHQYKIVEGDSTFLKIDSIKLSYLKFVNWKFQDQTLYLISSTDSSNNWKSSNVDSTIFTFKKVNKKVSLNPTEVYKIIEGQKSKKKRTTLSLRYFL